MIKAPALSASGDLDLSTPGGSWSQGMQVIGDRTRYELNIRRGEWYFDADGGFDLITIGRTRYSKALLEAEVRRCMGRVPGILAVKSVTATLNPTTRALSFTAELQTSEGLVTTTGEATPDGGFLVPSFAAAMVYQMSALR